jgi:DNA-binding NtrC family response regulator/tetratricopeptide (TPR) repeat protein
MSTLNSVRQLKRAGYFIDALTELHSANGFDGHQAAADVLRCELFQLTGRLKEARLLADNLLRHPKRLSSTEQSTCEYILARVAREDANINVVLEHLQRAISLARSAPDLNMLCQAQLMMLIMLSDRHGPDAVRPLASEIRKNVTLLGDTHVTASLHIAFCELEAKRGLFRNARRHGQLAVNILQADPNCWMQARAQHLLFAIDLLRSDYAAAQPQGDEALRLAEAAGHAAMCRNCLANLGNLFYFTGQYERAVTHFERALAYVEAKGTLNNAAIDCLALVRLAQGQIVESFKLVDRIFALVPTDDDRHVYPHRHSAFTKTLLLAHECDFEDAIAQAEVVISLADHTGDTPLRNTSRLMKAELLLRVGRTADAIAILESAVTPAMGDSPELYAQYERVLAIAAATARDIDAARVHHRRGVRLARAVGNVPAEQQLDRVKSDVLDAIRPTAQTGSSVTAMPQMAIHSLVAMTLHPSRLDFVARELISLLVATDSVYSAAVLLRSDRGTTTLEDAGDSESTPRDAAVRTLSLGLLHDQELIITMRPKTGAQSVATLNALAMFVALLQELEQARREREDRAVLWPVEELPIEGDSAVLSGHMRKLMEDARRIARTGISVLITGESGTGKEILARAIHRFSDRAHKPFVPFNCTAVPHALLESQLFGHRRGAFTGADRDYSGLIRAARDGTLFLDEIGELGLEVQPKLLRFLESGEIATLGDPSPATVNVRIVAATNRNLDQAVRDGKFREDLFYRLNVVRLSVDPLRERRDEIPNFVHHFVARAAEEFNKGRVTVSEDAMERLLLYRWPGNVRQLQNEVRRMVALADPDSTLTPDAIDPAILGTLSVHHNGANGGELAVPLKSKLLPALATVEREMIKAALTEHGGRVSAAAKALGLSRKGLYLKRQRLGL